MQTDVPRPAGRRGRVDRGLPARLELLPPSQSLLCPPVPRGPQRRARPRLGEKSLGLEGLLVVHARFHLPAWEGSGVWIFLQVGRAWSGVRGDPPTPRPQLTRDSRELGCASSQHTHPTVWF